MALTHSTQTKIPGAGLAARLNGTFANWRMSVSNWNRTRATRKELYRLSEAELEDIGLCRADIDKISAQ